MPDGGVTGTPSYCSLPSWVKEKEKDLSFEKAYERLAQEGQIPAKPPSKIGSENPITYGFQGVTKETNCLLQQLQGRAQGTANRIFGKLVRIDESGDGIVDVTEFSRYVKQKTGGDDPELYEDDIPPLARELWKFSILYTFAITEPPKPDAEVAAPAQPPESPPIPPPKPEKSEPAPSTHFDWRRWVSGYWPTIVIGALVAVGVAILARRLWIPRRPPLSPHPSSPRWARGKPPPRARRAGTIEPTQPDPSGARIHAPPAQPEGVAPLGPTETTQRFEQLVGGRPTGPVQVDVALPAKPHAPRPGTAEEIDFAGLSDESGNFEALRQRLIHGIERLRLEQPPLYNRTHPEAVVLHDQLAEMMRRRYGSLGLAEVPPLEALDEIRLIVLVRKIRALEREAPLREIIEQKLAGILERSRQAMGSGIQYELSVTRSQEFLKELALRVKDVERTDPVRLKVEELLEAFHAGA